MDVVIPIVFPGYKIAVEVPRTEVDVFPFFEWDDFTVRARKEKLSNLGHAGVLFINGETGLSKYYEYGRYDRAGLGLVRRVPIPDAEVADGAVELASLKKPLHKIARVAGQSGNISGVFLTAENKFEAMLRYSQSRKAQNRTPGRRPYSLASNSCIHFVKKVVEVAGLATPWMVDPRPTSYVGEFRDDYPDLDYEYGARVLAIEGKGAF